MRLDHGAPDGYDGDPGRRRLDPGDADVLFGPRAGQPRPTKPAHTASDAVLTRISLCSGLLRRGDHVLLVRCAYAGEPSALWVLPGGRQEEGETLAQTVVREFREETSLRVTPEALAYVSESIDRTRGLHVVNCTFFVSEDDPSAQPAALDPNVTDVRFVPVAHAPEMLAADVLRIPVSAALSGDPVPRYFAFKADDAGVPFFDRNAGARSA